MEKTKVLITDNLTDVEVVIKDSTEKSLLILTRNANLYNTLKSANDIGVDFFDLKKNPSEYYVSAWDFIDELNEVIFENQKEKSYLYQLDYHVEGNSYAKKIVESIAYYDCFDNWFEGKSIVDITAYYSELYERELELLYYYCIDRKIVLNIVFDKAKRNLGQIRLWVLTHMGNSISKKLTFVNSVIKNVSFLPKYKLLQDIKRRTKFEIGLIKQSAQQKDYNWTRDYLNLLHEAEIDFAIICMNEEIQRKWTEWGYKAENIQESISKIDVIKILFTHYRVVKKINRCIVDYLREKDLFVNKEKILSEIYQYLYYQAFEATIQDKGASRYFENSKIGIVEMHGNTNYLSTKICYYNIKKYSDFTKFKNCTGSLQVIGTYNYEPYAWMSDFGFIISKEFDKLNYKIENVAGRQYVIKNTTYSKSFYNKSFHRQQLRDKLSVLWAPSYPYIGTNSYVCFNETGRNLFEFFSGNTDSGLFFKFHPNQSWNEVRDFVEKSENYENILFVEQSESIRSVLAKVDILITNCSLSILDGVVEKKAVISVVSEYEYASIKHLSKGVCIIKDYNELLLLLQHLSEDEEFRKTWIEERVNQQEEYFKNLIGKESEEEKIIQVLKKELESVNF